MTMPSVCHRCGLLLLYLEHSALSARAKPDHPLLMARTVNSQHAALAVMNVMSHQQQHAMLCALICCVP